MIHVVLKSNCFGLKHRIILVEIINNNYVYYTPRYVTEQPQALEK